MNQIVTNVYGQHETVAVRLGTASLLTKGKHTKHGRRRPQNCEVIANLCEGSCMANNPIEVVIARARIGDVDASLYADILEYLDVCKAFAYNRSERTAKVGQDDWNVWLCGNCQGEVGYKDNYCSHCGARLEWE